MAWAAARSRGPPTQTMSIAASAPSSAMTPLSAFARTSSSNDPTSSARAPLSRPNFARRPGGGMVIALRHASAARVARWSRTDSPAQVKQSGSLFTFTLLIDDLGKRRRIAPLKISSALSRSARTSPVSSPTSAWTGASRPTECLQGHGRHLQRFLGWACTSIWIVHAIERPDRPSQLGEFQP